MHDPSGIVAVRDRPIPKGSHTLNLRLEPEAGFSPWRVCVMQLFHQHKTASELTMFGAQSINVDTAVQCISHVIN